jgi:hypothetical protein
MATKKTNQAIYVITDRQINLCDLDLKYCSSLQTNVCLRTHVYDTYIYIYK